MFQIGDKVELLCAPCCGGILTKGDRARIVSGNPNQWNIRHDVGVSVVYGVKDEEMKIIEESEEKPKVDIGRPLAIPAKGERLAISDLANLKTSGYTVDEIIQLRQNNLL